MADKLANEMESAIQSIQDGIITPDDIDNLLDEIQQNENTAESETKERLRVEQERRRLEEEERKREEERRKLELEREEAMKRNEQPSISF